MHTRCIVSISHFRADRAVSALPSLIYRAVHITHSRSSPSLSGPAPSWMLPDMAAMRWTSMRSCCITQGTLCLQISHLSGASAGF